MSQESNDKNNNHEEVELEWEEWDGRSPFFHHCIAGSIAGVAEHTLLYPLDTVKTHMQSYCVDCPATAAKNMGGGTGGKRRMKSLVKPGPTVSSTPPPPQEGAWGTMRRLMGNNNNSSNLHPRRPPNRLFMAMAANNNTPTIRPPNHISAPGFMRLWRGVQTMAVGCVPAHALYFSSYEAVKALNFTSTNHGNTNTIQHLGPFQSALAGATATILHDSIMTPLDTIKQRLQLGHYDGMTHALRHIIRHEGTIGLYRSFPITLLTNVPYGAVLVSTNEFLRSVLSNYREVSSPLDFGTTMMAGSGAGAVAAAVTAPLDRVKTRLQTQRMGVVFVDYCAKIEGNQCPRSVSSSASASAANAVIPKYDGWVDALRSIVKEEGWVGLFRGMTPRVMTHTPAVAISWTSYEAAKQWLASSSYF